MLSMCKQGYNPYYTPTDAHYVFLLPRHVFWLVSQKAVENEWLSENLKKLNRKIIIIGEAIKKRSIKESEYCDQERGVIQKKYVSSLVGKQTQQFEINTYSGQKANLAIITSYELQKKWIRMSRNLCGW